MTTMTTTSTTAADLNSTSNPEAAITPELLKRFDGDFDARDANRIAQNAVTTTTVTDIALDRSIVTSMDHTFSNRLDEWSVTNQKKSGRCWCFAGLNLFRVGAMKKMNIESFEFSQNYTLFWDKFERANYFLEQIIATADRDIDDRTVAFLLDRPLDDGGQWTMFINIINKHGVVPQSAMPETESSSSTMRMNQLLLHKLREIACTLRSAAAKGADITALRSTKHDSLSMIYRILCIHLGTPPTSFDWQWQDKDKKFQRDGKMTPRQFAENYITLPLNDYVCLVNDPRDTSPIGRTFTVECLGNVTDGQSVKYLNVEMDMMKDIAMRTIQDGEPVWFGCDVGKMMHRDLGLWDANLYDYESLYGTSFGLNKAERLLNHQTLMTHAMLFTGVDIADNQPRRWRVENSWGDEGGVKGYYTMNDSWFDEHMFEIGAKKSYLPQDLQDALDEEPIVLAPWDPMGALAHG